MKFALDVDAKQFQQALKQVEGQAVSVAEQAMNDVIDELIRISSEITPFDKGVLTASHTRNVKKTFGGIEGSVTFSAREGDFNYALWIHEGIYNHGEGTMQRGKTAGWSGKTYYAGRKYLERPMKGEQQAFLKHIAKEIKSKIG